MSDSAGPPPAANPTLMDSAAIQRILPHRYPMLLIDRVVVSNGDVEIRCVIPTPPNSEKKPVLSFA